MVAALREAKEELYLEELKLTEIGHFYYSFNSNAGVRQHWKTLYLWFYDIIWDYNRDEIYKLESFDSFEMLNKHHRENPEKFSNAVAIDMKHLRNYFNK